MSKLNERFLKKSYVLANYDKVDKAIGNYSNCCNEGCSHCCYQPIEIVNWEKYAISDYIKTQFNEETVSIVRSNLIKWADIFNNEHGTNPDEAYQDRKTFREKVNNNHISCPFLIDNRCSIYDVRPLACRSHIMVDNPDYCKADGLREAPEHIKQIRDFCFSEISSPPGSCLRYLPVAVSDVFGLHNKFKPHPIPRL